MVSVRVSLLLLCVAIAAHSVSACYTAGKGDFSGDPKYIFVSLETSVTQKTVNLHPTHIVGAVISGLKVLVCELGHTREIKGVDLMYLNNNLIITRPETQKSVITLDIVVYISPVIPNGLKALENGALPVEKV